MTVCFDPTKALWVQYEGRIRTTPAESMYTLMNFGKLHRLLPYASRSISFVNRHFSDERVMTQSGIPTVGIIGKYIRREEVQVYHEKRSPVKNGPHPLSACVPKILKHAGCAITTCIPVKY